MAYGLDRSKDAEADIFNGLNDEYGWCDPSLPEGRKPYDYKYNILSKNIISALDK